MPESCYRAATTRGRNTLIHPEQVELAIVDFLWAYVFLGSLSSMREATLEVKAGSDTIAQNPLQ